MLAQLCKQPPRTQASTVDLQL